MAMLATDLDIDVTGQCFNKQRRGRAAWKARDEDRAAQLWTLSADLVDVDANWPQERPPRAPYRRRRGKDQ
ncbi:MAG: hypothetical protein ABEJ05_08945 [Haloglomus sp.]